MPEAVLEKSARGEQLKRDNIVIRTYDLWKTYVMGDQEIHAVSGVDCRFNVESMWPSWGLRDPASRR